MVGAFAEIEVSTLTCIFAVQDTDGGPPVGCGGYAGGSAPYRLALGGEAAGLVVVAQDVPAAEFSEEALRGRLADPADLEVLARTHHSIVTTVAASGPVIPLPFATLFTDADRAAASLEAKAGQFRALLDRLRDHAEWAVKVYAKQIGAPRDGAEPPRSPSASVPAPGAGRAYLDRVRARRQDQEAKQAAALAEVERIDAAIRALADGAVRRRPHGAQVTGKHRVQLFNGAYLVNVDHAEQLHAAIDALRADTVAVEIEASGPWVPYSFAETSTESCL
ncbi:GvpL/GvpF family gas vesicle protein [Actinospica robiniae]|uniref:GvpL/GvpF family gas vesicle protein n=1 Tax=Actinospica robiniae TaxID=304901 RepID=UPI0004120BC2|nr:GvpL/GvpF family gas vesicle protein [Actinospica robiniae]